MPISKKQTRKTILLGNDHGCNYLLGKEKLHRLLRRRGHTNIVMSVLACAKLIDTVSNIPLTNPGVEDSEADRVFGQNQKNFMKIMQPLEARTAIGN